MLWGINVLYYCKKEWGLKKCKDSFKSGTRSSI
jgi:hypothetical protein